MPRYLTINRDLQIIPDSHRHLSASKRSLEAVIPDVEEWIEENQQDQRVEIARAWLEAAGIEVIEIQMRRHVSFQTMGLEDAKNKFRPFVKGLLWSQKVRYQDLEGRIEEMTDQLARKALGMTPLANNKPAADS